MTPSILSPLKHNNPGNFLRKLITGLAFSVAGLISTFALPGSALLASALFADTVFAQEPNPGLNEANLSFVGADIESVIKAIGHYTGTTFIVDPRVKGTINLVTEKPVTKKQAFELLTSTLRLQGYAVVTANGFTKVVPESDGKLQAGPTQVAGVRGDQIATQVYRLNYESAANLVTVLRPLISPNNTISADQGTNSVVITDYADNLKRLGKIIATLDVPSTSEIDVIPLKHAIAGDVAALVLRLTEQQQIPGPSDGGKIAILAESRTNSILLHAPSEARANLMKKLIAKLDQPTALPGNVHVVYLRNADAVKLALTLRSIVAPDSGGTGSSSGAGYGSSGGLSSQRPSPGSGFGSSGSSGFGGASGSLGGSSGGFGGGSGGFGSSGFGSGMGGGSGSSGSSNAQTTLPSGGAAGFIQADSATNTLIITASEPVYRNLRAVIDQLDARRAQVYIEALVIDVSATDLDQFGVQWAGITGNANTQVRVGGATAFDTAGKQFNLFALAAAGKAAIPPTGFNLGVFSSQLGLGAIASALQQKGLANVLSVPTLTTLDNEEANVLVGQNVPFVTGQYTNAAAPSGNNGTVSPFQTVERKDVGIILKVRPQISEGGAVKLVIYQEVSDVDPATNPAGIITNKRAIDTTVIVDDGEVLVLGGLMGDTVSGGDDQVPILGDIPLIGRLFKYSTRTRKKRNLLIFLRPTVIRNTEQSNSVSADRYDYMRAVVRADKPGESLLDVPPLAPQTGGMLIPQTILNRESTSNRLDLQGAAKSEPLGMETPVTQTPMESIR